MKQTIKYWVKHSLFPVVIITLIFLNVFCVFVFAQKVEENQGQCGNPITEQTRIECGCVLAIDGDELTIEDETGNIWKVEIGNPSEFSMDYYYCIFFDTMGTNDIKDDEIVKLWREVW